MAGVVLFICIPTANYEEILKIKSKKCTLTVDNVYKGKNNNKTRNFNDKKDEYVTLLSEDHFSYNTVNNQHSVDEKVPLEVVIILKFLVFLFLINNFPPRFE